MQLYLVRVVSVIAIALVYMLFDLFNKRNVPNLFAYSTLAYGIVLTILFLNLNTILISTGIALIVLGVGYTVYRMGQLGGADVIEFAALSLIMPLQMSPLLTGSINQFGLPFMLSLLLNAGIIAIIIIPIYYLPKARARMKKPLYEYINRQNLARTAFLAVAYLAFISYAAIYIGIGYIGIIILLLILGASCSVMLFSVPLTHSMIEYVSYERFEEGDIVAFNLMDRKSIESIKGRVGNFDRLLTQKVIDKFKKKKIRDKLPVYKEAMPFAVPIFVAVLLSILVGNLLFFIFTV
jgi:Flp pilus assembly protein protease CpaA